MRRLGFTRRPLGLAVLSFAIVAACGDGITLPGRAAGYYRLVSVNGQPVPYVSPPSLGVPVWITRGDLVLRPNGTYRSGLGGNLAFGFIVDGRYRIADGELTLQGDGAPPEYHLAARLSGDSITFEQPDFSGRPLVFTYRRTPLATSTVPSSTYRLRSINGRTAEPLVAFDTTIGDRRSVAYVNFDSLEFSDGVFFRRHRAESGVDYINGQESILSASEWTTWGAYESGPGWLLLFHYSPPLSVPSRDSLSIATDTLVRRTRLITGIHEERYVGR